MKRRQQTQASGGQWRTRWGAALALLMAVGFVAAGASGAEAPELTEYQVKAAFLYNFAKFVEWPDNAFPGPQSPIVIGIVGNDPFGDVLDGMIEGKRVRDRKLVVKRWEAKESPHQCHILFVGASERRRVPELLSSLRGASVLTVGESEGFAERGGVVNFTLINHKVHFEINVEAAQQAKLTISSKLLALATIVGNRRL